MRRLLALLLLAAFGLPAAAPLLAQTQDFDARLPACCRRAGAHHCLMAAANNSTAPAVSARCPQFPQPTVTAPQLQLSAFGQAALTLSTPETTPTVSARAETQRRISRERSRHKRGPPAAALAA